MIKSRLLAAAVAMLTAAGCGNAQRVEKSLTEVHSTLLSMPAGADVMGLATTFPSTAYYLEPDGGRLIWHFTHDGKDYGRFIATLSEDGANATEVSTHFEEASDAAIAGNLDFLRKMAKTAGEASVNAALTGQPVDRAALQQEFQDLIAQDPMAAHSAAVATVSSEMSKMAPPDPCDSDDRATRERCETFERNRGPTQQSTVTLVE